MKPELSYASSLILRECTITTVDGETLDITDLVVRLDYFESISLPTIEANLDLVDTGSNIISSLPIQGYEDIKFTIATMGEDDGEYEEEYEFKVFRIHSRYMAERFQKYSLGLISKEALINETQKVTTILTGKPDGITRTLLTDNLQTSKAIFTDPSLFKIRFLPGKKTPFSIIESMRKKSVADESGKKSGASSSTGEFQKASGSAGYYFYENKDGYHFNSIDRLNSLEKNPPRELFTQEPNHLESASPQQKILDIDFQKEIDILSKLRMGTFSNVICYYNFSTGAYEEYNYKLQDSFDEMEHLGSQSGLGKGQAELAAEPSRIMSVLVDHETWFDGVEVASPEKPDGGGQNTAEFPDWQKNYIAQNISRLESQNNQQVLIKIPVRLDLRVGQTVEIQIPNNIPTEERQPDLYDPEHSGVYLIAKLNHAMSPKEAKGNTHLTLVRDSYGRPDDTSNVAT
jgi:hypothetical protein